MPVITSYVPPENRPAGGCLKPVWSLGWQRCRSCDVCRAYDQWQWNQRGRIEAELRPTVFATWTFRPRGPRWVPTRENTWPDVRKCLQRMRNHGHRFRYFCAPEFGDRRGRHHFHLLLHGDSITTKNARSFWKQGITHARRYRDGDADYVAGYAAKQSGRKCASLRYGFDYSASLVADERVKSIFKHFDKAKIAGVGNVKLPHKQRKKLSGEVREQVPYQPIPRHLLEEWNDTLDRERIFQ